MARHPLRLPEEKRMSAWQGFITSALKEAAGIVAAANPSPKESDAGNETLYVPVRVVLANGKVANGSLSLTLNGSRFFGLSEAEAKRAKAAEKTLREAKASGIPLPPEAEAAYVAAIAAAREAAKAAREANGEG